MNTMRMFEKDSYNYIERPTVVEYKDGRTRRRERRALAAKRK